MGVWEVLNEILYTVFSHEIVYNVARGTISIPAVVEDADAFMEQFVGSFKEAHEITILKKKAEDVLPFLSAEDSKIVPGESD